MTVVPSLPQRPLRGAELRAARVATHAENAHVALTFGDGATDVIAAPAHLALGVDDEVAVGWVDGAPRVIAVLSRAAGPSTPVSALDGNTTEVRVPVGNLRLVAEHGAIELVAARGVSVKSGDTLSLESRRAVELTVRPVSDTVAPRNQLTVDARGLQVVALELTTRALRATVEIDTMSVVGRALTSTVQCAQMFAGVLETHAQRVIERARNVYRDIEELALQRAGEVRMVARESVSVSARTVQLSAQEDMKLKGETIHLA